jgi:hypothetical protein
MIVQSLQKRLKHLLATSMHLSKLNNVWKLHCQMLQRDSHDLMSRITFHGTSTRKAAALLTPICGDPAPMRIKHHAWSNLDGNHNQRQQYSLSAYFYAWAMLLLWVFLWPALCGAFMV